MSRALKKHQDVFRTELIKVLVQIRNPKTMDAFLRDLLTPQEYQEVILRWQIVKQLEAGVSQRDIVKNLGVAVATVTRGARVLQNPHGAFVQRLRKK